MKALHAIVLLTVAVVAPLAASQADSRSSSGAPTVTVRYAKDALLNPTQVQLLQRRLEVAARQVCRNDGVRGVGARIQYERCYTHALHEALQQVDAARAYAAAHDDSPTAG